MLNRLRELALEKSPFCAGIDLKTDQVPAFMREAATSETSAMLEYGKLCIDVVFPYAAAIKFQIACYEAYGLEGMRVYSELIQYAKSKGAVVMGDIKRGDIGSTAEMYARAHLSGDFEVDIVTLSPFMGEDAISPYYPYFGKGEKAAFLLAKTSNPSSVDFQDKNVEGAKLYDVILDKILEWKNKLSAGGDYTPLGAVVAVNAASDIEALREKCKDLFLLVPGYGAQGARLEDLRTLLSKYKNGVVNVSRGYTAGLSECKDMEELKSALEERAAKLAQELRAVYE